MENVWVRECLTTAWEKTWCLRSSWSLCWALKKSRKKKYLLYIYKKLSCIIMKANFSVCYLQWSELTLTPLPVSLRHSACTGCYHPWLGPQPGWWGQTQSGVLDPAEEGVICSSTKHYIWLNPWIYRLPFKTSSYICTLVLRQHI